ncbi:MAG: ankyrin repeat domain-containing protein [Spirochaetota bacterium]
MSHSGSIRRTPSLRAVVLAALLALGLSGGVFAQSIPSIESEETPLHWAAGNGLTDIAARLIDNGALVSAPDHFGRTPLHRAVRSASMVELLIDAGAAVNASDVFGRTPLHEALPYPDTVRLLLDAGADVTAKDFMGHTPLDRSLRYGTGSRNRTVITLLLEAGAGAPPNR